jgi:hypothetical protein
MSLPVINMELVHLQDCDVEVPYSPDSDNASAQLLESTTTEEEIAHLPCFSTPSRHRISMLLGLLLAAAFAVGMGMKEEKEADIPSPWNHVSAIIGWLYFWAWSVSFYPQVGLM